MLPRLRPGVFPRRMQARVCNRGEMENFHENKFEHAVCDLCGGGSSKTALEMRDPLYGVPGLFRIVECSSCGFLFTNPRPKPGYLDRLYQTYYGDHESRAREKDGPLRSALVRSPLLRRAYHRVFGNPLGTVLGKARGRVLDVGCGTGAMLKEMEASGLETYGVEPNPKAVQACLRKGLRVVEGTLENARYPAGYFDTIILSHVIEHVPSPRSTLGFLYPILKPGGRVFISCPNARSYMAGLFKQFWAGWHIPFHLSHFTPETMKTLILETPFQPLLIRAVTPDFLFPLSLEAYIRHEKKSLRRAIGPNVTRTLVFRGIAALFFRFLDALFSGKGECLQVEIMKPGDAYER
jgi:2-polyprenyl-3-methyl-5-hydroxy-6-metoxy-1,4-benzoquinol methylase